MVPLTFLLHLAARPDVIALVASLLLQSPQLPQKHLVEDLRVRSTEAEELQSVGRVIELGGAIYVTDPRAAAVFRVSGSGRIEGRIGRSGQGPGEYRSPSTIGVRGDSLWIGDPQQRRIVIFGGDGRAGRTVTLVAGGYGGLALQSDGSPLLLPGWGSDRARPDAPPRLPVLRFHPNGEPRDTLFSVEVELGQMQLDVGDGGFLIGAQRFGDSPLLLASPSGDGLLVIDRRTTGPAAITLTRRGVNGEVRWSRSIPYTPAPLDRTVVDSVVDSYVHPSNPAAPAISEGVVRKALLIPARAVPVLSAEIGADGTIWLRRPTPTGVGAIYTVCSPDGRPIFEVTLPKGGRLSGSGAGAVWLTLLDEDDLPTVVRYRIERGGA